jgi:hypothetical protein
VLLQRHEASLEREQHKGMPGLSQLIGPTEERPVLLKASQRAPDGGSHANLWRPRLETNIWIMLIVK